MVCKTVIVIVFESVSPPSLTLKVTLYVPTCEEVGAQEKLAVLFPLLIRLAPAGKPLADRVSVLLSESVAPMEKLSALPA